MYTLYMLTIDWQVQIDRQIDRQIRIEQNTQNRIEYIELNRQFDRDRSETDSYLDRQTIQIDRLEQNNRIDKQIEGWLDRTIQRIFKVIGFE